MKRIEHLHDRHGRRVIFLDDEGIIKEVKVGDRVLLKSRLGEIKGYYIIAITSGMGEMGRDSLIRLEGYKHQLLLGLNRNVFDSTYIAEIVSIHRTVTWGDAIITIQWRGDSFPVELVWDTKEESEE
jgi:hypothetical protein